MPRYTGPCARAARAHPTVLQQAAGQGLVLLPGGLTLQPGALLPASGGRLGPQAGHRLQGLARGQPCRWSSPGAAAQRRRAC